MIKSTKKSFGLKIRVRKKENRMVLVDDLVEKMVGHIIFIYQRFFKNSVNSEETDVAGVASKKITALWHKIFQKNSRATPFLKIQVRILLSECNKAFISDKEKNILLKRSR